MNLSYGLAKTGGATEFDWAFDTDLGIQTNFESAVSIIPAKGAISKLVSGLANLTVSTTITADAAGTTTALATTTTSAAGAGLTVLVSSNGIIINSVAISVAGTGYLPGDTVTVTKVDMDADTNIGTVSGDLVITLTVGNFNTVTPTTAGSGYSVPLNGTILCNTTGSATGTGAQILVRTDASSGGLLVPGSSVVNTAGFNNYQNALLLAYDPNYEYVTGDDTDPFTYARVTTDDKPFTGVSAAVEGTSLTGTAGIFIVTVSNGSVTAVEVSAAGTGYKVGDVVTITKAALEAGGGNTFQGDLQILLNDYNITGQVIEIVRIMGGSGYAAADVLTLQEVGSSQTGTAEVTVGTLDLGQSLTPAPNSIYPRAVRVAQGTIAAPVTIEFVGMNDVNFTVGGLITGTIFPMNFKQIKYASVGGTDVTLGLTKILY
jgi:hypothetical protein